MTYRVKTVESASPPSTTLPSPRYSSDPGPGATVITSYSIHYTKLYDIFGMLPLVVAPGPGSELYRGLGSVVLGGLALSTVFTLYVV